MGFNELMILTNTVPVEMVVAPAMGVWLSMLGVLCAAAAAVVALKPQRQAHTPHLRAVRLSEVPVLG